MAAYKQALKTFRKMKVTYWQQVNYDLAGGACHFVQAKLPQRSKTI